MNQHSRSTEYPLHQHAAGLHAAGYGPGLLTGRDMCNSPPPDSDSSVNSNRTRGRPSPSPNASPTKRSTDGRLSSDAQRLNLNTNRPPLQQTLSSDFPSPGQKRQAPSDAHYGPRGGVRHQSQRRRIGGSPGSRAPPLASSRPQGSQNFASPPAIDALRSKSGPVDMSQAKRNDSGYVSAPSRSSTMSVQSIQMLKEPDQATITKEQLAAEVKGIYTGLVMVEAKCINIDAAQANEHKRESLSPDQWQALIALHRTLLYEHHDFLMATQHPSATDTLKNLAIKYSMPARMWKHSIHAFLEVLRHRRPESQEYMLQFIYFAYSMMALLYETVPSFKDTWIECLGDLARYRMAVEEDKEAHSLWGTVAARWYHLAADRDPKIGRLNHHLGILERPSLKKLFFYMKSLTCEVPFQNARDSLTTVCNPIVKDPQIIKNSQKSAEACLVTVHALLFRDPDAQCIDDIQAKSIEKLSGMDMPKFQPIGASLGIVTVSIVLGIGEPSNPLFDLYFEVLTKEAHSSRSALGTALQKPVQKPLTTLTLSPKHVLFAQQCIIAVFSRCMDESSVRDSGSFCVLILAFYQSLVVLREKAPGVTTDDIMNQFLSGFRGNEVLYQIANYLNTIMSLKGGRVNHEALRCAKQKRFLEDYSELSSNQVTETKKEKVAEKTRPADPQNPPPPERREFRPMPEDYQASGIVWMKWYYPEKWFPDTEADDTRNLETEQTQSMRLSRCEWSGFFIAFAAPDILRYDEKTRRFWAPPRDEKKIVETTVTEIKMDEAVVKAEETPTDTFAVSRTGPVSSDTMTVSSTMANHSPTSTTTWSATSEVTEEDYSMVNARKVGSNVAAHGSTETIGATKQEQKFGGVKVEDSEDMDWQNVEHA